MHKMQRCLLDEYYRHASGCIPTFAAERFESHKSRRVDLRGIDEVSSPVRRARQHFLLLNTSVVVKSDGVKEFHLKWSKGSTQLQLINGILREVA